MRNKLLTFFIFLWYCCTLNTAAAQVELPGGVWEELLSANEGTANVEAASDDSVSDLLTAMVDFLCSDSPSTCAFQCTQGAAEKEMTTFAFDHIFRGAHFQAMLSLHPLKNEASYQLWQLYFIHFPERDVMYEIRIYQNPKVNNKAFTLWKTDLFSNSYFFNKSEIVAIHPDFEISTSLIGLELFFVKPWIHPQVEIFDLTGQVVYRSNSNVGYESNRTVIDVRTEIETTGWAPGIYMIRLNEGPHSRTKKFYLVP